MYVLGLTGFAGTGSHDAAAALLKDGVVIAAVEEERLTRKKHSWGLSPIESAHYCLSYANLQLDMVDAIAYGWNTQNQVYSTLPRGRRRGNWINTMLPLDRFPIKEVPPIYFIRHHVSHIAGAFYLSGFENAACMCVDGQGENEAITLAFANRGNIDIIKTYDIIYSLGALYEAATFYCGMGYHAPGKLMGLASYGLARHSLPINFDEGTGEFSLLFSNAVPGASSFTSVRDSYIKYFENSFYPFKIGTEEECMAYVHVAASVQYSVQTLLEGITRYLKRVTDSRNLVLSGGVALNCTSNGALERSGIFENVFVPPGANDASCSIGAAMEVFRMSGVFDKTLPPRLIDARIGPSFSDSEIARAFSTSAFRPSRHDEDTLYKIVAEALYAGSIVVWFQGRAEFGPRALGARSIIASPCDRINHCRVNALKGREIWRPLSPSILEEKYEEYYTDTPTSPASFMLKASAAKSTTAQKIPAVVHIDGSSRPQVVHKAVNPRFYGLISAFEKLSGVPILLNTSLNLRGEPIVNSPTEALELFARSGNADVIVIGNYLYKKST